MHLPLMQEARFIRSRLLNHRVAPDFRKPAAAAAAVPYPHSAGTYHASVPTGWPVGPLRRSLEDGSGCLEAQLASICHERSD